MDQARLYRVGRVVVEVADVVARAADDRLQDDLADVGVLRADRGDLVLDVRHPERDGRVAGIAGDVPREAGDVEHDPVRIRRVRDARRVQRAGVGPPYELR